MAVFDMGNALERGARMGAQIAAARQQQNALAAGMVPSDGYAPFVQPVPVNVMGQTVMMDPFKAQEYQQGQQDRAYQVSQRPMAQAQAGADLEQTQAGTDKIRAEVENVRAMTRQAAAETAAKMDDTQRRASMSDLMATYNGARSAWSAGEEAWYRFLSTRADDIRKELGVDWQQLTYDDGPVILGMLQGASEGVRMASELPASDFLKPDQGPEPTADMRNLEWRAQQAGLQPGTPEYMDFMRTGGNAAQSRVVYGPDGSPVLVEGDAATTAKFTEQQSKDNVYSTRARGALEALEPVADALVSRKDLALGVAPFGATRGFQSDDFQVAQQAGTEFLQAILRKDTGAAITQDETESYGRVYLPQPGDSPAVLQQKREARARAINALESGMSPAQMLARDRALIRTAQDMEGGADTPATGGRFEGMSRDDLLRVDVTTLETIEDLRAFRAALEAARGR